MVQPKMRIILVILFGGFRESEASGIRGCCSRGLQHSPHFVVLLQLPYYQLPPSNIFKLQTFNSSCYHFYCTPSFPSASAYWARPSSRFPFNSPQGIQRRRFSNSRTTPSPQTHSSLSNSPREFFRHAFCFQLQNPFFFLLVGYVPFPNSSASSSSSGATSSALNLASMDYPGYPIHLHHLVPYHNPGNVVSVKVDLSAKQRCSDWPF